MVRKGRPDLLPHREVEQREFPGLVGTRRVIRTVPDATQASYSWDGRLLLGTSVVKKFGVRTTVDVRGGSLDIGWNYFLETQGCFLPKGAGAPEMVPNLAFTASSRLPSDLRESEVGVGFALSGEIRRPSQFRCSSCGAHECQTQRSSREPDAKKVSPGLSTKLGRRIYPETLPVAGGQCRIRSEIRWRKNRPPERQANDVNGVERDEVEKVVRFGENMRMQAVVGICFSGEG